MMKLKLEGVIVPLLTPLDAGELLDEAGLERLIEYALGEGASGVLTLGTTGEFALLRHAVRARVVDTVVRVVAGRVPVLAGISEAGTRRAVEFGHEVVALGADAVVATAPYYFTHSQSELCGHFTAIADEVAAPLFIYNVPQRVKTAIEPATVRRLAEHPNVVGLKDSSGDLRLFEEFLRVRESRPDFLVTQGGEAGAGAGVLLGADALVLGPSNVAPRLCRELFEAARRGDAEATRASQARLDELCAIYRHKSGLAGMKAALHLLGLCAPTACEPFEGLSEDETEQVRQTLIKVGVPLAEAVTA